MWPPSTAARRLLPRLRVRALHALLTGDTVPIYRWLVAAFALTSLPSAKRAVAMSVKRVAAIDCGTNTIRLLIADVDPATRHIRDVMRRMEIVRLGQGVDKTGQFDPEAIRRTLEVTKDYAGLCRKNAVESLRFVATSATRDASNRGVFIDGVRAAIGVEPEVVSGTEEAALSFAGALTHVVATPPYLIVDLGGGSTELVLGVDSPQCAFSMDVGSVRLRERRLVSDPHTSAEIAAATADIDAFLDIAESHVDVSKTRSLVGVAGTVTSIAAYHLGLRVYDPEKIDGLVMSVSDCVAACRDIVAMTTAERLALGFLQPGRADVLGAGALVWSRVLTRVHNRVAAAGRSIDHVTVSEHDILDGIALSLA